MNAGVEPRLARVGRYFEKYPQANWVLPALWVFLVGGLSLLWQLGSTGLVDETEPLFAEAARQMTVTGDWITPYFNGETRFDKPPLIYWCMAFFYQTLGVNEWSVRLPSALAAIALMGMGFYLLRRFGSLNGVSPDTSPQRWLAATIGSALIGLHPSTIAWARTGVSDMLLSGCMGLALMTFFCGYATTGAQPSRHLSRWYLACYILTALAILTKGPVGIVLPGLIIGCFLLFVGNWRDVLREMRFWWGMGIIVAIALPWYVLVFLANGQAFIDAFFGYHNVERFTSVVNRHWAPWYFYFVVVLVGFAPWSVYLPMAIARLQFWKPSLWQHQPRTNHLGIFALIWFVVIFGFFTIAVTKLPSYVLPLMPAAAILVALGLSDPLSNGSRPGWGIKLSVGLNALVFAIIAGALLYVPQLLKGDRKMPELPILLQDSGLPVMGAIVAGSTAVAIALLLLRRQIRWVWVVNTVGLLTLLVVVLTPAMFLVDAQRQLPLRQLSQIALQQKQPGEELVMIGFKKPSVVFYSHQQVTFKRRPQTAVPYLRQVATQQPTPPTMLLLASSQHLAESRLSPAHYQSLGQVENYELVRVAKPVLAQLVLPSETMDDEHDEGV